MRHVSRVLLTLTLAAGGAVAPAAVALAAGSGSVTTTPSAEAWYRFSPLCATPLGCPSQASPYAADTLHVGVNLGAEEDRTVLQLDLTKLPAGTKPAGGQLRLPVATGPQDGSRTPETAKIRACPLYDEVEDVDGSFADVPEPDCKAASVDAVYEPAAGEAPAAFTVDLAALAAIWQESVSPGALVLLPAEAPAPTDAWHVAFSRRDREGEGVARITAAISFVGGAVDVEEAEVPPVEAPLDSGFVPPPALTTVDAPPLSAPGPIDVPVAAPAPVPAPAPQPTAAPVIPVASVVDTSFRYPGVFLLPLALAVVVGWLGRAMTRDLTEIEA
jgi:hypothetical protein